VYRRRRWTSDWRHWVRAHCGPSRWTIPKVYTLCTSLRAKTIERSRRSPASDTGSNHRSENAKRTTPSMRTSARHFVSVSRGLQRYVITRHCYFIDCSTISKPKLVAGRFLFSFPFFSFYLSRFSILPCLPCSLQLSPFSLPLMQDSGCHPQENDSNSTLLQMSLLAIVSL